MAVGRVRRGGGWANDARHCQSAYRGRFAPAYRIVDLVCLLMEAMILHYMNARLRKVRSLFLPGDQAVDTFQDRADEGS